MVEVTGGRRFLSGGKEEREALQRKKNEVGHGGFSVFGVWPRTGYKLSWGVATSLALDIVKSHWCFFVVDRIRSGL